MNPLDEIREAAAIDLEDHILREWNIAGVSGEWDCGTETWHLDENWCAWFDLSLELFDRADDWLKRNRKGTRAWNEIARISDSYLVG